MIFIDTNYFLRFLLGDNSQQFSQVKRLFKQGAKDQIKLFTNLVVIFEIYWVINQFYRKSKKETVQTMNNIFSLSFIEIPEIETLQHALQLFEKNSLEFEDCYHLAYARENGAKKLATFDQKLAKQAQKFLQ